MTFLSLFVFLLSSVIAHSAAVPPAAPPVPEVDPAGSPKSLPELVEKISAARGTEAMVVTAHPLATQEAVKILESGGNAVDAAVAAQWILNVAEPQSSGIGGGGFFLYYNAKDKSIHTFDGREKAPVRAFPEMFLDENKTPLRFYPDRITGGLPVGVPGTLKLLKRVHNRFASRKFKFEELFEPAIRLARQGVPVSPHLANAVRNEESRLKKFPGSEIFFHADGTPLSAEETLVQASLAKTFETIAQKGVSSFYEGEIARAMVEAVQKAPVRPGYLTRQDLQFYDVVERDALHGTYRGHDIFTMGPPSSGGVALLESLNILENFSLILYGPQTDTFHLVIEAQKIAFEDRAKHLGDPDFVKVPAEKLTSKDYGKKKAKEIKFEEAHPVELLVDEASFSRPKTAALGNTSHISIIDAEGNIVSYTTTLEYLFGSAMMVPGWGFFLNNELTDFDAEPRAASAVADSTKGSLLDDAVPDRMKGKLKPNAAGPEKRPRSSMCPVIIFRNGRPFFIGGSPGGSLIIPTVQNLVLYTIDFRMPPEQVLSSPRFAARGYKVEAEAAFFDSPDIIDQLKARGHWMKLVKPFGNAQVIFFDTRNETFVGISDPRGEGEAKGY